MNYTDVAETSESPRNCVEARGRPSYRSPIRIFPTQASGALILSVVRRSVGLIRYQTECNLWGRVRYREFEG